MLRPAADHRVHQDYISDHLELTGERKEEEEEEENIRPKRRAVFKLYFLSSQFCKNGYYPLFPWDLQSVSRAGLRLTEENLQAQLTMSGDLSAMVLIFNYPKYPFRLTLTLLDLYCCVYTIQSDWSEGAPVTQFYYTFCGNLV